MEKRQITITVPQINLRRVWPFVQKWLLPNPGTLVLMVILTLTIPALALPSQAPMATSISTIPYQGRLADSAGTPVTAMQNMEFRIYDVPTGGTPLWEELWTGGNSVSVSDGLFSVLLGSLESGLATVVQTHDELYLGVTVGTDSEMSPRVQLGSVPFSMQALTVPDGSITTNKIADAAVTIDKLAFHSPSLLGEKTCNENNCGEPIETAATMDWLSFKGATNQDVMEVTVTTQGGPVMAYMTGRYRALSESQAGGYCGIYIYQNDSQIQRAIVDGIATSSNSVTIFTCSGGYLFTDLPAGTYTFRAMAYVYPGDIRWERNRQIVVMEY